MKENIMKDIIGLCLQIDTSASDVYTGFSSKFSNEKISQYWKEMADEEKTHIEYWQKLDAMADENLIPVIFDNPERVVEELSDILKKISKTVPQNEKDGNITRRLLVAYRLEFYMLHRAFGTLFHFIKNISGEKSPVDNYESHIDNLIKLLDEYSESSPELELVGESLQRLWHENKMLIHQNMYDFLTGVLSRRGMMNTILPMAHLAKRKNETVGVLMIDIDNFKMINDKHGHLKGDEVLKNVALGIQAGLRRSDIVGRYGGEEFLVFLPSVISGTTDMVAEKIRESVCQKSEDIPCVTVSIGFRENVLSDKVDEDLNVFIMSADDNMYKAKKSGKNCVVGS